MSLRGPLTEIAYKALSVVQARCERDGLDLFEELNRVGLIATAPRIEEIQTAALKNMYDQLETLSANHFLTMAQLGNSNPGTPADLYIGVLGWIRRYIQLH